MEMEGGKFKTVAIVGAIALFIIIILYNIFRYGEAGAVRVIQGAITSLFWLVLIGLAVTFVWFLFFFVKEVDVLKEVYNDMFEECGVNSVPNLGKLYMYGDEKHHPIDIGRIIGYSHRISKSPDSDDETESYSSEDVFKVSITKGSPLRKLFPKTILVRMPTNLHDDLQGDVGIHSTSLVKHGYYYYPSNLHMSQNYIDETMYDEGLRYLNLSVLKKFSPVVNKGLGLTRRDLSETEGKTGTQIIGSGVRDMAGGAK